MQLNIIKFVSKCFVICWLDVMLIVLYLKNLGCMADNSSLFVAYTQKNVINMGVAISKTIP